MTHELLFECAKCDLSVDYMLAWMLDAFQEVNNHPAIDLEDLFRAWIGGGPL